jgi:hypothetical protein
LSNILLISLIFLISTLSISVANESAVASEQLSQEKVSDLEQCNPDEEICNENGVNQSATEKQASGDDESRPSDSIKAEGQDEVHQEGQETESKNAPDPLKINETAVQVSINFQYLTFHKSHDLGSNIGQFLMYLYIDSRQKPLMIEEGRIFGNGIPYRIDTERGIGVIGAEKGGYLLTRTSEQARFNSFSSTLSSDRPLSIMMGGYEIDGCPLPKFPKDISNDVYAADGNKETLLEIQKKLTPESTCPFDMTMIKNPDNHDVLGYINEVYNPVNLGADSPNYLRKCVESTGEDGPDFKLCYTIYTKHITLDVQK